MIECKNRANRQESTHSLSSADSNNASSLYRRDLFRMLGAGLLLLIEQPDSSAQESGRSGRGQRQLGSSASRQISAWLHIEENGKVTAYTGKVEVGQNIRTALTQAVAEELRTPVATIQFVMGDTALTPYDMGTFGSRSTPTMIPQLRHAAACAREAIIDLAAAHWQVDRSSLTASEGMVLHAATSRKVAFGPLVKGQTLTQTITNDVALTPVEKWQVAGSSTPKIDGRAFVTGRHRYTSDINTSDTKTSGTKTSGTKQNVVLYGKVLRPDSLNAFLKSVDTGQAEKMPGVKVVHDGDFVGVVAPTQFEATRALAAIRAEWQSAALPSEHNLTEQLRPKMADAITAVKEATDHSLSVQATYTIAYIAHAPLEPRAAVAEWKDDHLTVWTGTQRPFGVRSDLATALHISEDHVQVVVPDTGSGYGGKHTGEAAIEAARLAKAVGSPVKVVWTREEEFTWAYFRPAGVIDVAASTDMNGAITQWEFHNYNSGPSGLPSPYSIPDPHVQFHPAPSPLRQGSYRGLAATANHFARESHMDDLAHAVKMDPLAFRLKNLQDDRLKAVLEAAAERFGWNNRKQVAGHGYGIAAGTEKGGYVANCVEVAVERASGKVSVTRIVAAFECGAIVNPTHLQNQIEGATVMGLGGALFEAIRFDQGRILNPHFAGYRVPRFQDVPHIDVVLVNRKDLPSAGAGETGIVAIAPAIGNAIFDATGERLRTLPMAPDGLKISSVK